jgi:hypothetical protein
MPLAEEKLLAKEWPIFVIERTDRIKTGEWPPSQRRSGGLRRCARRKASDERQPRGFGDRRQRGVSRWAKHAKPEG